MVQPSVAQIPNLPAAAALSGTELMELVQSGVSVKAATLELAYYVGSVLLPVDAADVSVDPPVEGQSNVQAALEALSNNKVNRSGDTMTGDLIIEDLTPRLYLNSTGGPGYSPIIRGFDNGIPTWGLDFSDNTFSDFAIDRFGSLGTVVDRPMTISYGTGEVSFNTTVVAPYPATPNQVATQQYALDVGVPQGGQIGDVLLNNGLPGNPGFWAPYTLNTGTTTRYTWGPIPAPRLVFGSPDNTGPVAIDWTNDIVIVQVNGTTVYPGIDYSTLVPNTITFFTQMPTGTVVEAFVTVPVPPVSMTEGRVEIDTSSWVMNGVNVRFPLVDYFGNAVVPAQACDLWVSLNGVWQSAATAYVLQVSDIIFVDPPEPDTVAFGTAFLINTGSMPRVQLNTTNWNFDGVQTTFPLEDAGFVPINVQGAVDLAISLDGVWQNAIEDYTTGVNTVIFTTAPIASVVAFGTAYLPPTGGGGSGSIYYSDTPPLNPTNGELWVTYDAVERIWDSALQVWISLVGGAF